MASSRCCPTTLEIMSSVGAGVLGAALAGFCRRYRSRDGFSFLFTVAETVYNLLIFVNKMIIEEVGFVLHHLEGTDEDKLSVLRANVDCDYKTADRYRVRGGLAWEKYHAMERTGRHLELFEQLFRDLGAPADPLFAHTAIVDGSPRIDLVTGPAVLSYRAEIRDHQSTRNQWAAPPNAYRLSRKPKPART